MSDIPYEVSAAIRSGDVLPVEALERYPLPEQEVDDDTGINVLLDLAHHCYMGAMWRLAGQLKAGGFRCVSSHACLGSVLKPGALSLVRTLAGEADDGKPIRPFIRWPNCRYNVVLTFQADGGAPVYTEAERGALGDFVREGGGLVIFADINGNGKCPAHGDRENWPLLGLLGDFGAGLRLETDVLADKRIPGFDLRSGGWESMMCGEGGMPVVARRFFGEGRVALVSSLCLVHHPLWTGVEQTPEEERKRGRLLGETIRWASGGSAASGGDLRLPDTHGGAGGIYPEIEKRIGNIHILYSGNQPGEILQTIEEEYIAIRDRILGWLPSPLPEGEPLRIILGAGIGGGWAVNAFYPKENGIISYELAGLVGIFAHEFAHILSGPRNNEGRAAAHWFDGNQSEAHAGFFQGRILALYTDNKSMRDCNTIFDYEKEHGVIDLGKAATEGYGAYGGGHWVWRKLWYVWQKLDDRYGTTWYPRWRWVQHTRWQDTPDKELTLEEMIEDMSIAVGEDLFPFFCRIGTTLTKDRFEDVEFRGRSLKLAVAPVDDGPAGDACLEPAGDYTAELVPG